ncbi:MAG: DUF975 family protein [Oscillospiraceae bacterium]|nr:DUF975 family protein [Oscillospiraceae bacterium]
MEIKKIKKHAIDLLYQNWAQPVAIILIVLVFYISFSFGQSSFLNFMLLKGIIQKEDISLFSTNPYVLFSNALKLLVCFFVLTPVYIGAMWWFLRYAKGEKNSISIIFICYANARIYFKTLLLKASITFLRILAALPACFFGAVSAKLFKITMLKDGGNGLYAALAVCFALLAVLSAVLFVFVYLRYALAEYIFVTDPDMKISRILKLSASKMKGNEEFFIKLYLSFLWWVPSMVLVFPAFFVVPYYAMAHTVTARTLLEEESIDGRPAKRALKYV